MLRESESEICDCIFVADYTNAVKNIVVIGNKEVDKEKHRN